MKDNAPSVKRVIWTGSCASVIDYDNLVADPPRIYTEADWNPVTWEEAVNGDPSKAYRGSKLFAEREGMLITLIIVGRMRYTKTAVCTQHGSL